MIKDTSIQDQVKPKPKGRAKIYGSVLVAISAITIGAFAYPAVKKWTESSLTIDASRLRTAVVERGKFVRDVAVQGQVIAAVRPMLFSPENGRVTTHVRSGDKVAKGDLLATIESPELLNQHEQEQSTLQRLETELSRQRIEIRMQHLEQKESLALSEMELTAAKRELRRAEVAHKHSAIALQDYEKAIDDMKRAEAIFEHEQEEVTLRKERLDLEVAILEHSLNRQRLNVEELQRQVSALQVLSPVNGVIGNLEVDQKSVVVRHQPIMSVVDMSAYEVEASVPESYADDLAQGMSVDLDFSGEHFKGELSAISPEIENGLVRTRIRFVGEKPEGLRQNQRVGAQILLEARNNVLMVARGTFMQSGSRGYVYVVEDDIAVRTPFSAGMTSVGKVEVLGGIQEGQKIVISSSDVFEQHDRVLLLQ